MCAHRAAFAYDWRTRFGVRFTRPSSLTEWQEAWDLFQALSIDPGSHVFAAMAGWAHPMSRAECIAAQTHDVIVAAFGGKQFWVRPWNMKPKPKADPAKAAKARELFAQLGH